MAQASSSMAAAAIASDVLARAALVHRFDPLAPGMIPADLEPAVEAEALARVATDATETEWADPRVPGPARTLWRLTPDARRRELRKLIDQGRLDAVSREMAPDPEDKFALYLRDALRGAPLRGSVPEKERESAVAAASFAADVLGEGRRKEAAEAAARELRATLTDEAEEQRSSGMLCGKLVGRRDEASALETFAATGAVSEPHRLAPAEAPAIEIAACLVIGPSGAGKSALVADLVRRWRGYSLKVPPLASWTDWHEIMRWTSMMAQSVMGRTVSATRRAMTWMLGRGDPGRVVVLDLDRPVLAVGGELEWTSEVTRQIGIGNPSLASRLKSLRDEVRRARLRLDPSGTCTTALWAVSADLKRGLVTALDEKKATGAPLVLVLDDFEEAVERSFPLEGDLAEALVGRILLWANSLATLTTGNGAPVFGAVRVIAAGNESLPLDEAELARWFRGRLEIERLAEMPAPTTPGEPMSRQERVGPLRLRAEEVASLPGADLETAMLSRMELARLQGRPLPRVLAATDPLSAGSGEAAAADVARSSDHLFAFLRERGIGTRIDYAFTFADFATAAAVGWRPIGMIPGFPDLSEPWRVPVEPVAHWIWQAALATLALDEHAEVRARLETFLESFARCLDPVRARSDATGLALAAAATVALRGRLPPRLTDATRRLAEVAARLETVRSLTDLRLVALRPLWSAGPTPPARKLRVPCRRLQLFSESLLSVVPSLEIRGLEKIIAFVADARIQAPSAREIDTFVATDMSVIEPPLESSESAQGRLADILVGLSPELYDCVVTALADADRAEPAAIDRAIDVVRARAPFWPRDVLLDAVPARDRDRRAGLIARSVIHADRCGLLRNLVEASTEQAGTERLRAVTRLVHRYEDVRRMAWLALRRDEEGAS